MSPVDKQPSAQLEFHPVTQERMADLASQAGFRLTRTLKDLLEVDVIYILHRQ